MKNLLQKLARDRLVWFIALGLGLFVLEGLGQRHAAQRIVIDLPLVEKLVAQWQGQTKRQPTAVELDALIEGYIREEILVREAQRMGLDEDDVIIRRRLAQKVDFFLSENGPADLPDEAALRQWFEANRARYDTPPTVSWQHIFAADEAAARTLLQQVRANPAAWRQLGQPFMLNRAYARQDKSGLAQLMGGDFATRLMELSGTDWQGPVQSAYGWHVVKITAREAAKPAGFEALADRLAVDWQAEQARRAKQQAWQDLRASYTIELAPVDE